MKSIYEELLSMKTPHVPLLGDTDTVYSDINSGEDPVVDNELPDFLSYFNERVDTPLERKCSPPWPPSNFL